MIPKIIHQTCKELKDPFLSNINFLKKVNPDWEHRFYNDDDILQFIKNNFSYYILKCYLLINPEYGPCRADFFRYLVLYKIGGVYLDIKSTCYKKLNNIIYKSDRCLLSRWPIPPENHLKLSELCEGEFINWFMAYTPNHRFLKSVIDDVCTNIMTQYFINPAYRARGKQGVLELTGPIAYTLSILSIYKNSESDYRVVDYNEENFCYNSIPNYHDLFSPHYSKLKTQVIL